MLRPVPARCRLAACRFRPKVGLPCLGDIELAIIEKSRTGDPVCFANRLHFGLLPRREIRGDPKFWKSLHVVGTCRLALRIAEQGGPLGYVPRGGKRTVEGLETGGRRRVDDVAASIATKERLG